MYFEIWYKVVGYVLPEEVISVVTVCPLGQTVINPLNAELNPICYLLALLETHHFLYVSRIRVNTSAHCSGRKQVKS